MSQQTKYQLARRLCLLGSVWAGTLWAITVPRIQPTAYVAGPDPQAILMTFVEGPDTRGFAWQTDDTVKEGELWIVAGTCAAAAFDQPGVRSARATSVDKSEGPVRIFCHKAGMTGLAPGAYSYRLGAPNHYAYGSFTVRAVEARAPVTIVNLSDAQPRSADKVVVWENTVSNAAAQVAALGLSPDLVLTGGDLFDVNWFYSQDAHAKDANYWFVHPTYGAFGTGSSGNEAGKYKYNYWKWGLDIDVATPYFPGVPWALARGNHDCEGVNGAQGGKANGDIYYDYVTAVNWRQKCHSFDYGNVHVLVLPCLSRGDDASLYGNVAQWAEDDLQAVQKASRTKWTIVEMHWGPYTTGDHGLNADGLVTRFAPIFSRYHVDLVIQAHDHTYSKTLPYRWDTVGYTTSLPNDAIVNRAPATETIGGEAYDVNPCGTYYVICGCSGHRVGEDGTTYVGTTGSKSYTTRPHKVAVGTITTDSIYANRGDSASQNPSASMFGVLRIAGDTLAYDFYAVATNGLSAPVLFDTLRVKKTSPPAARFSVTPYVQHPATNAMSVLFFTREEGRATVKCWPSDGGGGVSEYTTDGIWAEALTNNLMTSDTMVHGRQYRHRVRLEGLATGTRYTYAVELENTAYTNEFRTAPGPDTPIRFIYYNDSETQPNKGKTSDWVDPRTGANRSYLITATEGYASNIVEMVKRDPDFFVIAGDLAAQGGKQQNWDEFWKHNAGAYNDPAGSIPILAAIGNHDLQDAVSTKPAGMTYTGNCENYYGGELAIGRYLSYFEYEPNGVDYHVGDGETLAEFDRSQLFHRADYGPVTLIFLDTNNGNDADPEQDTNTGLFHDPNNPYHLPAGRSPDFNPGSKQYAWLTNNLADAQRKSKFTFVVQHQCPYSVGYHNRTNITESGEWLSSRATRVLGEALLKYGVDGWLCGHDEMMEHSQISGFETLPDGTTRPKTLNIYDMGTAGDGLRGGQITKERNAQEVWRAHVDAPEIYDANGRLVDGGKHYGHMEINVTTNAQGRWRCTLTPVYIFVGLDANNRPSGFERREYDDVITLDENGTIVTAAEKVVPWWRNPTVQATLESHSSALNMNTHYMNKDVGDRYLCVDHCAGSRQQPFYLFSIPQIAELVGTCFASNVAVASTTPETLWGAADGVDMWKGCAVAPDGSFALAGLGGGSGRYTAFATQSDAWMDGVTAAWRLDETASAVSFDISLVMDGLDFSDDGTHLYSNDYAGKTPIRRWRMTSKEPPAAALDHTYTQTGVARIRNISVHRVKGRELVYYGEGARTASAASVCVLDVTNPDDARLVVLTNAPTLFASDIMNVKLSGTDTRTPTLHVTTDGGQIRVFRLSADGFRIVGELAAFDGAAVWPLCGIVGTPATPKFRNFEVSNDGTYAFMLHDATGGDAKRADIKVVRTLPDAGIHTVELGGYTWTYEKREDGDVVLGDGSGVCVTPVPPGRFHIPTTLAGLPVTSYATGAFKGTVYESRQIGAVVIIR